MTATQPLLFDRSTQPSIFDSALTKPTSPLYLWLQELRAAMPEPTPKLPRLPAGWTLETYEGYHGRTYTRAVDPDGCRWYAGNGESWRMNVPWFRRSPGLGGHVRDDLAIVETVRGNEAYPITEAGVIKIGRRRILPHQWDH